MASPMYTAYSNIKFSLHGSLALLPVLAELVRQDDDPDLLMTMFQKTLSRSHTRSFLAIPGPAMPAFANAIGLPESIDVPKTTPTLTANKSNLGTHIQFLTQAVDHMRATQRQALFDDKAWAIPQGLIESDSRWRAVVSCRDMTGPNWKEYLTFEKERQELSTTARYGAIDGVVAGSISVLLGALCGAVIMRDGMAGVGYSVWIAGGIATLTSLLSGLRISKYFKARKALIRLNKNPLDMPSLDVPIEAWRHHPVMQSWEAFEAYERGELTVDDDVVQLICQQLRVLMTIGIICEYQDHLGSHAYFGSHAQLEMHLNRCVQVWQQYDYRAYAPCETYLTLLYPWKVCEASLLNAAIQSFSPEITTPQRHDQYAKPVTTQESLLP